MYREYHGITTSCLEFVVLTQGEGPDYNIQQIVEIGTQDRDDLDWNDDDDYFNYGDGSSSDDIYPQRISAVKVFEPTADGQQGDLSYAFWFDYNKLHGFGHPTNSGDSASDYRPTPKQALTRVRQFGSDFETIGDPSALDADYVSQTSFSYDAFIWDEGENVPDGWTPNEEIGNFQGYVEGTDIHFSYGVEEIALPTGGTSTFEYERREYPLATDVVEDDDASYPSEKDWAAIITSRESNGVLFQYDYYGDTLYGFEELLLEVDYWLADDERYFFILNGKLGFTGITETQASYNNHVSTSNNYDYFICGDFENCYEIEPYSFDQRFFVGYKSVGDHPLETEYTSSLYRHFNPLAGTLLNTTSYALNPAFRDDWLETTINYEIIQENEMPNNDEGHIDTDYRSFHVRKAGQISEYRKDGEGSIQTEQTYEYDEYDNVVAIHDLGDVSLSGDETYTEITYWEPTISHIHNKWILKEVYLAPPAVFPRALIQKATQSWIEPGLLTSSQQYYDLDGESYLETTYEYDDDSNPTYNLTSKTQPGNRATSYTYSSDIPNLVETETNPLGQTTSTKTYYDNGLPKDEIDLNGNTTSYAYDKFGRILAIWLPDDDGFNPMDIELGSADLRFYYFRNEGDTFQETLLEHKQPDGDIYQTIFAYDGFGNMVRRYSPFDDIRDGNPKTKVEMFDYSGNEQVEAYGPQIVEETYGLGNWPSWIPWDGYIQTTYYDEFDRPHTQNSFGLDTSFEYGIADLDGILRQYKEVRESAEEGVVRITKYFMDAKGSEIAAQQYEDDNGILSAIVTTRYERDRLGNLTSIIEPEVGGSSSITSLSYDDAGRLIQTILPGATAMPGEFTNDLVYNEIGELTYKRSPNLNDEGKWFKMVYDVLGRVLEVYIVDYAGDDPLVEENDSTPELKFQYYYDSYPVGSTIDYPQAPSLGEAVFGSSSYDNILGRLAALNDGNASYLYYYDTRGNLVRVQRVEDGETLNTDYYYNHAGQCLKMRYPSGDWVWMDYDELGSLYQIDGTIDGEAMGFVENIDYNGAGMMTELKYDNDTTIAYSFLGAKLSTLEADLPGGSWCYFRLDSLEDINYKNIAGISEGWTVDDGFEGHAELTINNPEETVNNHQPPTIIDNSERILEIQFDQSPNPPLYVLHGDIYSPLLSNSFYWPAAEYLEYDILIEDNADSSLSLSDLREAWGISFLRRDKSHIDTNPPSLIPDEMVDDQVPDYNAPFGKWYHVRIPVEELYDPTWEDFDWGSIGYLNFNRSNRLCGYYEEYIYIDNITMSFQPTALDFTYDYDGHQIESIADLSSLSEDEYSHIEHYYEYDERTQLSNYLRMDETDPTDVLLREHDYSYNDRGNRTSYSEEVLVDEGQVTSSETLSYEDGTNRITNQVISTFNPAIAFTLDPSGNVIESVRTDGVNTATYSYDYDFGNRMTELTLHLDGDLFDFASLGAEYNASGIRTRRVISENNGIAINSEDRRFVYDQWGHLIAEYVVDGGGWELDREYINDANSAICIIDYDDEGEPRRGFILKDHLGSTRVVVGDKVDLPAISSDYLQLENVDSKVEILWTGDYEPFGRPIETAEPLNPDHYENPIRYTGYYYDGDVFEHYYAMARYYDPYLGRFLSRDPENFDPAGSPALVNRYLYCTNNPVMYKDPNGRFLFMFLSGIIGLEYALLGDFIFTSVLEYFINPEEGVGGALLAGFSQLTSDALLLLQAYAFSISSTTGYWGSIAKGIFLPSSNQPGLMLGDVHRLTEYGIVFNWLSNSLHSISGSGLTWNQDYVARNYGITTIIYNALLQTAGTLGSSIAGITLFTKNMTMFFNDFAQTVFGSQVGGLHLSEGTRWLLEGIGSAAAIIDLLVLWLL